MVRNSIEDFKKLHEEYKWSGYFEVKNLAKFLRINPRTIHRWLSGQNKPSFARMRQVATYLDYRLGLLPEFGKRPLEYPENALEGPLVGRSLIIDRQI